MKTFKDLVFKRHSVLGFDKQARIEFSNGFGVSVISGACAYGSDATPYEVAITHGGILCYSTKITDDVIGYCDETKVTEIMEQVQKLKSRKLKAI